MSILIEPKPIEIRGHKYIISKLPALIGRKLSYIYPLSHLTAFLPKVGNYNEVEEAVKLLMYHVGVPLPNGEPLRLSTPELIDSHVPNFEVQFLIEKAMAEYNVSFFENGRASKKLSELVQKFRTLKAQISTVWSTVWLEVKKLQSPNSEKN